MGDKWRKLKMKELRYEDVFFFEDNYYVTSHNDSGTEKLHAQKYTPYKEARYCDKSLVCRHLMIDGNDYHFAQPEDEYGTRKFCLKKLGDEIVLFIPSEESMWTSWYPGEHLSFYERFGISFEKAVEVAPIECLLKIGKAIASTDYAVRYFHNKNHPKFYLNKRELLRSVRKSYSTGAFEHRKQAEEIIKRTF